MFSNGEPLARNGSSTGLDGVLNLWLQWDENLGKNSLGTEEFGHSHFFVDQFTRRANFCDACSWSLPSARGRNKGKETTHVGEKWEISAGVFVGIAGIFGTMHGMSCSCESLDMRINYGARCVFSISTHNPNNGNHAASSFLCVQVLSRRCAFLVYW